MRGVHARLSTCAAAHAVNRDYTALARARTPCSLTDHAVSIRSRQLSADEMPTGRWHLSPVSEAISRVTLYGCHAEIFAVVVIRHFQAGVVSIADKNLTFVKPAALSDKGHYLCNKNALCTAALCEHRHYLQCRTQSGLKDAPCHVDQTFNAAFLSSNEKFKPSRFRSLSCYLIKLTTAIVLLIMWHFFLQVVDQF